MQQAGVPARLLLQVEHNGELVAHVGMFSTAGRSNDLKWVWPMSNLDKDDLPYGQATPLRFTHVIMKRKAGESDLVTVDVLDRTFRFIHKDFYWIKNAAIGSRAGFPQKLLLPDGFVLSFAANQCDSCRDLPQFESALYR